MKQQRIFCFRADMEDVSGEGEWSISVEDQVQTKVIDKGWHIDQISTAIDSSELRNDTPCYQSYVLTIVASKEA